MQLCLYYSDHNFLLRSTGLTDICVNYIIIAIAATSKAFNCFDVCTKQKFTLYAIKNIILRTLSLKP